MYFLASIWLLAIYSGSMCLAKEVSDVKGNIVAQNEGLYIFYESLGGWYWTWADYDTPWVFEEGEIHDPCAEEWTGYVLIPCVYVDIRCASDLILTNGCILFFVVQHRLQQHD